MQSNLKSNRDTEEINLTSRSRNASEHRNIRRKRGRNPSLSCQKVRHHDIGRQRHLYHIHPPVKNQKGIKSRNESPNKNKIKKTDAP